MGKIESRLARKNRHARVRAKLRGTPDRPRLCVFRSLNHIYAQIIDDSKGHTMACASSLEQELKAEADGSVKLDRAKMVGTLMARRAQEHGVSRVVFDRGGYKYHGRIKALAEAARQGGLKF